MRVSDEVRQCVVFIGLPVTLETGQLALDFRGTAFFVSVPSESAQGWHYIYLVTAKHVATGLEGKPFMIRVNTKDGSSTLVRGEGARWWYHTTNEFVDIAVIPWAPPEQFEYKSVPVSMFLSDEIIQSNSIGCGDEVFITGLFAHLSGSKKNLPIVRMGNIAMMPGEPVPTKAFGDIEAYLIEARSIGGLSGSPAFVRRTVKLGLGAFYLLGLMHGHWDIPPESKNDAVLMDKDLYGRVNMGIAIVIPARKILEVLNQSELLEGRRRKDEERRKQTTLKTDELAKATTQKEDTPKQES